MTINSIKAALLALALGTVHAGATDGTWNVTSGNWNATGSWAGGNIANGIGASASFTNASGKNGKATINMSPTLGILNLGPTGSYAITLSASSGTSLTFDNTSNSANAQINFSGAKGGILSLQSILLNSSLVITDNSTSGGNFIGGTLTNNSPGAKTITFQGTNTNQFEVDAIIADGTGGNGSLALVLNANRTVWTGGGSSYVWTYTGGTTITQGNLQQQNGANTLPASGPMTINGGALDLWGLAGTIGSLSGSGGTINSSRSGSPGLTVNQSVNGVYSGTIASSIGALTKSGTATLTLANTNSYSGATNINQGTLRVNGSLGSGSAVTVNNNGTLGGTGTINGTVAVTSGGTVLTGATGATLTLANSAAPSYGSGTTLKVVAAAATLDKVSVSAASGNSVANVDLVIDTTSLGSNVSSTDIYVAGGAIAGPFHSVTVVGNTAFSPTLDYSTSGHIKLALAPGGGTPTITVPATLPDSLATTYGTASPAQTVVVTGANLANGITVTAQTGFEVSIDSTTFGASTVIPQSGGSANSMLWVRLAATATAGSHDAVTAAILTSTDATTVDLATSSNGNLVAMATPAVTVTVGTYYYTGSPLGPNSYTTSPSGDTGTPTWNYAGTGTTSYGPSPTPPTAIGTYDATVSLAADSNFNAVSSAATAFTIDVMPPPVITAPAMLPGSLTTNHGTASAARSVAVSGQYLTADLTATAQSGFEVATAAGGPFSGTATFTRSGSNAGGTLYVRLAATAPVGSYDAQTAAILSSAGATPASVATAASGNSVAKGSQTITFTLGTIVFKSPGAASFADTATASSALTVTYSSDNTSVATVDASGTVTIVAAGTAHILANQAGDANWNAAPQVSQTLTVTIIANGGFEVNTGYTGGDATAWTKDGAAGVESGYLVGWGYNSGGAATNGFYQTLGVPLVAGLKYQLSYELATWYAGNQMHVRVGKHVSGNYYSDASYSPLPLAAIDTNPTGAWTAFSHTFTAVGGEDTVYFGSTGISADNDPGGKYDNVVMAIVPFTLTYHANGGTGSAPGPYSQNYGTTILTAPAATFTRTDYTFVAWNTAADGSGTSYAAGATFTFTADTTLYAQWSSAANYTTWAVAQSPPLLGGPDAAGADGLSNLIIYAIDGLRTDHSNGSAGVLNPATNVLSFTKRPDAIANGDVSWAIETSPDLVLWTIQVTQAKGDTTPTISCTLPTGAGKVFARLRVSQ